MSINSEFVRVVVQNDMHAYDNLPPEVRAWLQIHNSGMRCEEILYFHRHRHDNNVDMTLQMLQAE